ncbi:sigma 54-interacting transcriptional regulator [Sorangium sp. So ce134]
MRNTITPLIGALAGARCFEDAAEAMLAAMLRVAEDAIAPSAYRGRAKILRGMVHLRPSDGYRRLVTLEGGALGHDSKRSGPVFLPSATAWRWVAERRAPVSIDVNTGRVQAHPHGGAPVLVEIQRERGVFDTFESAQRLLSREASHLYVIPLETPSGTVDGMVSVEADCRSAIGQDFVWPACGDDLQLLATIAAPYLARLPLRPPPATEPDEFLPVIGVSTAGLVQMLSVFAAQNETILIRGPTGAGKSRLARWCHQRSRRRERGFESIDLMTVPEDLQRGELFGWRRGAFTGAVKDNPGCLARAEGGTLFIDEIDKLSLGAQASLLKVFDERRYRALGETSSEKQANVRFIIGTNADLSAAVRDGRFREDLYYRINVLPVNLPPLEERSDEIPGWARYFAERRHREGVPEGQARIHAEAEQMLTRAPWPGNLRQLDNIIRRAYAMALIDYGSAPLEVELEARHVERALGCEPGRKTKSLIGLLEEAAEVFVREAERKAAAGELLDLDQADAFRGFVLGAAARRLKSKETAFRLLGKENLVANRNHHKPFRRELEKAAALCRALGQAEATVLADLLEDER